MNKGGVYHEAQGLVHHEANEAHEGSFGDDGRSSPTWNPSSQACV